MGQEVSADPLRAEVAAQDSDDDSWEHQVLLDMMAANQQKETPQSQQQTPQQSSQQKPQQDSLLLSLPSELIHNILSYVPCLDLTSVARTCKCLHQHTTNDLLWEGWVNALTSYKFHDPSPYDSFKSLYIAHHPYWFLVRHRIWFSDSPHTGKLLIARYDHRLGSVEAYRAVVGMGPRSFTPWPKDPEVVVHTFNPHVRLWLDDPVLQLGKPENNSTRQSNRHHDWRCAEIPMRMTEHTQGVFNTFVLCPKATYPETERGTYDDVGPGRRAQLWPPPTIPSEHHVDRHPTQHYLWEHRPLTLSSLCETGFRTRRWVQFRSFLPVVDANPTGGVGESMETFSTIDPKLYTPTKDKPYQGIWVGDYAGNGCEFLLFTQRDEPAADDMLGFHEERWYSSSPSSASSTSSQTRGSLQRRRDRQPLEAIKLTGDPHVPRGEVTFRTDDVGPRNAIRIASEEMFQGARVVPAEGHVASRNFQNGDHTSPLPITPYPISSPHH